MVVYHLCTQGFPQVSTNGGTPKSIVYNGKSTANRVAPFSETSINVEYPWCSLWHVVSPPVSPQAVCVTVYGCAGGVRLSHFVSGEHVVKTFDEKSPKKLQGLLLQKQISSNVLENHGNDP